jgi:hypothetical protein
MASRMTMFYKPQVAQVNEEWLRESSLGLTLTQRPRDEDLEPRKVHLPLEVKPPRTWYYHISSNSRTLGILLHVDLTSSDKLETVYEDFYKIKDISIFAWSLILNVRQYHWLRGLIHQLLLNSKTNYLIRTIRRILNFLQL